MTIDCQKIQSITREKTAYVVPNAILICTNEDKVLIFYYTCYKQLPRNHGLITAWIVSLFISHGGIVFTSKHSQIVHVKNMLGCTAMDRKPTLNSPFST